MPFYYSACVSRLNSLKGIRVYSEMRKYSFGEKSGAELHADGRPVAVGLSVRKKLQ